MMRLDLIKKYAYFYKDSFKDDLTQLIALNSWEDKNTATPDMPFGEGVASVFDLMKTFCKREGLAVDSVGGYAFHADYGKNPKIGFATHLDTVKIYEEELWDSPPLVLTEKDGTWYGLGVNDDKAAGLLGLYAVKIIQQLKLFPKVRLIFGGAEETSWECMKYYLVKHQEPQFVMVADGNFPFVMVEKGMIQFELFCKVKGIDFLNTSFDTGIICDYVEVISDGIKKEFSCEKQPSRHPYRNVNALSLWAETMPQEGIWKLLYELGDGLGVQLGIDSVPSDITRNISNTIALIGARLDNDILSITGDMRFMSQNDREKMLYKITEECQKFDIHFKIKKEMPLVVESEDSPEIQILMDTYQKVSKDMESKPLIMGAMSYARSFKRAIAFGPCFPDFRPNSHHANEKMLIDDLMKSLIIYTEAILRLNELYNEK